MFPFVLCRLVGNNQNMGSDSHANANKKKRKGTGKKSSKPATNGASRREYDAAQPLAGRARSEGNNEESVYSEFLQWFRDLLEVLRRF